MTYRIRNILIAVGLALVAMLLTLYYVTNYKRSVQDSQKNAQVYVATHDLPAGTSGTDIDKQHDLKVVSMQHRDVVPGAISSPSQIEGLVLSQPVYAGEQVTTRPFSDAAAEGIRSQLKGTLRAVQIAGDPTQVLAGTLQPGDHVDLVANLKVQTNSVTTNADRIVLRDLTVLSTGSSGSLKSAAPSGSSSVILAVTDTQVQRLFYVVKDADWTLELRPVLNAVDSAERVETLDSIMRQGVR